MYKFSTDPKAAPLISFQEMLSVKAVQAVYMDESLVCMHVCLNNLRVWIISGQRAAGNGRVISGHF